MTCLPVCRRLRPTPVLLHTPALLRPTHPALPYPAICRRHLCMCDGGSNSNGAREPGCTQFAVRKRCDTNLHGVAMDGPRLERRVGAFAQVRSLVRLCAQLGPTRDADWPPPLACPKWDLGRALGGRPSSRLCAAPLKRPVIASMMGLVLHQNAQLQVTCRKRRGWVLLLQAMCSSAWEARDCFNNGTCPASKCTTLQTSCRSAGHRA